MLGMKSRWRVPLLGLAEKQGEADLIVNMFLKGGDGGLTEVSWGFREPRLSREQEHESRYGDAPG